LKLLANFIFLLYNIFIYYEKRGLKMDYTIENKNFKAKILSSGAELVSLHDTDGKSYIWEGDPNYWANSNPHLFPTVCSLKDDKAVFEGITYNLGKHGFTRSAEFELVDKSESETCFVLRENSETLKSYPYKFEFYVIHRLTDTGFETVYKVKNTDSKPIYYGIGGHPGFNCPMNPNEAFSDYDIVFEKTETNPVYQSTLDDLGGLLHKEGLNEKFVNINSFSLNYDIFKRDAVIFSKINSNIVKLINRNTRASVKFSFSGFNSLGIWSPIKGGAPFVCLEPWTVIPDFDDTNGIFAEKPGVTCLDAGEEKEYSYRGDII
jgi:galactose mutarotase-like enzyme